MDAKGIGRAKGMPQGEATPKGSKHLVSDFHRRAPRTMLEAYG